MADNENMNTEAIEPVEVVHGLEVGKSLLGATLGATATEQEPDEEFETIPVAELVEVKLGRQGENNTQTVVIDCSAWLAKLPGCTFMIAATRPGEREIYLPEVSVSSGVVTWPIMEQDTACAGAGRAEVRAMKDGKVKKSALFRTRVEPALEGDGSPDAPTPPNWVKLIIGSVEASQQAAETAQAQVQGALEAAESAEAASEAAQEAAEGAVRYNAAQALTEAERFTVLRNIGADGDGICVENNPVRAYLSETAYDDDDYSYTRVLDYAADDYDHPAGELVEWEYDGTCSAFKVRVTLDGDDARAHTYSLPNTARSFEAVNLIPGEVAEVKVSAVSGSAETVILSRSIRASGTVRMIAAEGVHNVRDIGGWKCAGGRIKYGKIYRGGILDGLTNDGKSVLHDLLGIRAEIDLRSAGSSDTSVIGAGCTRYRYAGKQYSAAFDDTSLSYEILHRVYTEVMAGNPAYVHCTIGCDRTGTYIGMIEGLLGMSESDISKDYELSDFTNSSLVDGGRYRNTANWTGLIGRIKGEAGKTFTEKVESYFLRIGFTAQEIENLRKALTNKVEIVDMVSRYAGRKMSFLGDSISTFNAEGYKIDGYYMYYPNGDVTSVEDTWFKQVLDGSGAAIEVNASCSGSRATNTHPDASCPDFYQRCGLLGNPDVIFVALGTNDSGNSIALGDYDFETATASLSEATFRTAYIKGVKALQANYPNAEIVLLIMTMGDGYADSIRHIGAVLGAQVVDCRGYQGGYHPNAEGMRWVASRVLYPVDGGLTVAGMSADAAAVGAALAARDEAIAGKVAINQGSGKAGKALVVGSDGLVTLGEAGVPEAVATALLDCLMHVAWIDDRGPELVQALADALDSDIEPVVPIDNIMVDFVKTASPSAGDSVDALRTQITVTAFYADGTSEQVTGYTLLPNTLAAGENTIKVRFRGIEKPIWVYVQSGTNDHCIFSIPAGTDIHSVEGISTGILLNDVNKSYTVLFKGTDESTEPTRTNQRVAFSSLMTLSSGIAAGVKAFIRYVDTLKYYVISHNGVAANFDKVSKEVGSQHEVCFVVRQSIANNRLTRMAAVFVDGVKADKISDSNLDASGYIHDKPMIVSNNANLANRTGAFVWTGHATVFRIYDTVLTDTEINAILGVTI